MEKCEQNEVTQSPLSESARKEEWDDEAEEMDVVTIRGARSTSQRLTKIHETILLKQKIH